MIDLNNNFSDIEVETESIKDEYDLSILHYAKTLELNPNSADAYYSIANSYYMKGEFNLALKYYTKAIEIYEANSGVYHYQGEVSTDIDLSKKTIRN